MNPGEENDGGRSPLIPFIRMSIPAKNLLGPFAEIARQSFVDRYSTADCTAEGGGGGGDGPGEGPPGGGDEDDGNERPNRFGFQVRKFVSPAGSIQFSLANERDVCIEAENLGAAIRILRDRFRPHIRPTTQERVAYRFEPKPSACRPPERPEGPDDEELAPTPDPLETDDSETPAETEDIPV